jgi:hypothetical protein
MFFWYRIYNVNVHDAGEIEIMFFDRVGNDIIGRPLISILTHHTSATNCQSADGDRSTMHEVAAVISRKSQLVLSVINKILN